MYFRELPSWLTQVNVLESVRFVVIEIILEGAGVYGPPFVWDLVEHSRCKRWYCLVCGGSRPWFEDGMDCIGESDGLAVPGKDGDVVIREDGADGRARNRVGGPA